MNATLDLTHRDAWRRCQWHRSLRARRRTELDVFEELASGEMYRSDVEIRQFLAGAVNAPSRNLHETLGCAGAAVRAASGDRPRVVVIAPARLGEGGLGTAAGDIAVAFEAAGCHVNYVGSLERQDWARRLAGWRPFRRYAALSRALDRRAIMRRVPDDFDLAYAVPGFLPRTGAPAVLHQATHHPMVVRTVTREARRAAGGGRGFLSAREARRNARELSRAYVVRTDSPLVTEQLLAHGLAASRILTAPPGVDVERYGVSGMRVPGRVVFVGAFSLWKGAHRVAELVRELPPYSVAVVGGPVCSWSRRLLDSLPVLRQTDVCTALREAEVMVLPSITDGFGYVVLEALAAGVVPVVTPAVGAGSLVRELSPDLVADPEDFVPVVHTLLSRPEVLRRLSEEARALASGHRAGPAAARVAEQLLAMTALANQGSRSVAPPET